MLGLSEITEKMYKHPFTVSKAVLQINIQTSQIQYHMEELIQTQDISQIHHLAIEIDKNHHNALEAYKIIFDRYLGDMQDITQSHTIFLKWEKIRENVINLQLKGKIVDAKIQKKQEGIHAGNLDILLKKLEDFAQNKAVSYNNNAQESKKDSIILIVILFSLIAIVSTFIASIVIKNFIKSNRDVQRYFHLIEQNVNIATLDLDASIKDVSHSLARLLNSHKELIIISKHNILFGEDEKQIQNILNTIKSSKQYLGEIKIELENEQILWVHVDIQPIVDSNFKLSGYTMIIDDITSKKDLEIVSITDGMTGLFNRREFDSAFVKRLELSKRDKKLLVFMMLDIDHFKLYNDNYGHQYGDIALKSVAKALHATFSRPDDVVYRLGGEEFGVLFSANDDEGATIMAQKVLTNIENLAIEHNHSSVTDHITISIGLGIISHSNYETTDKIYVDVDDALYKAKEGGRNRYETVSI